MTHQEHPNVLEQVLELLVDNGFDGMADACRVLYNEAMKIERADVLQAQPHERTDSRRGYANGFKPKTVLTRIGSINLAIPQTRGVNFYPQAIERGERSVSVQRTFQLPINIDPQQSNATIIGNPNGSGDGTD